MHNAISATYEDLASEYYDPVRHPTCANFREASGILLSGWLESLSVQGHRTCEVGPGKSLLAEILAARSAAVDQLLLVDSSPSMLSCSREWALGGVQLLVGDALALPVASGSVRLVVSSLGDSYNTRAFWIEVNRVLQPGGVSLFTTPSYDWAFAFRNGIKDESMKWAEFLLSDGRHVRVPSCVYPVVQQVKLVEQSGFVVERIDHIPISALKCGHLSPKLLVERGPEATVVTGYCLVKEQR